MILKATNDKNAGEAHGEIKTSMEVENVAAGRLNGNSRGSLPSLSHCREGNSL